MHRRSMGSRSTLDRSPPILDLQTKVTWVLSRATDPFFPQQGFRFPSRSERGVGKGQGRGRRTDQIPINVTLVELNGLRSDTVQLPSYRDPYPPRGERESTQTRGREEERNRGGVWGMGMGPEDL